MRLQPVAFWNLYPRPGFVSSIWDSDCSGACRCPADLLTHALTLRVCHMISSLPNLRLAAALDAPFQFLSTLRISAVWWSRCAPIPAPLLERAGPCRSFLDSVCCAQVHRWGGVRFHAVCAQGALLTEWVPPCRMALAAGRSMHANVWLNSCLTPPPPHPLFAVLIRVRVCAHYTAPRRPVRHLHGARSGSPRHDRVVPPAAAQPGLSRPVPRQVR